MGLYDRDYSRDEMRTPWDRVEKPRSMTIVLIVINVVVFFLDMIVSQRDPASGYLRSPLIEWGAVQPETLIKPWLWWQFLTYGFLHDNSGIGHILFNMIGLFVFGRIVEQRIGGKEFLRFYLVAIVIGGIVGSAFGLAETLAMGRPIGGTIGASGAVVAVTILFACYFPHTEVLLFFVLPIKAWVLAVAYVVINIAGAFGFGAAGTAFQVHLAGAAFGALYYFRHWNLRWLDFGRFAEIPDRMRKRSRRMKLKLHDPDRKLQQEEREADRILAKIHDQGEESLTSAERRTLERYSRRQRQKRGG